MVVCAVCSVRVPVGMRSPGPCMAVRAGACRGGSGCRAADRNPPRCRAIPAVRMRRTSTRGFSARSEDGCKLANFSGMRFARSENSGPGISPALPSWVASDSSFRPLPLRLPVVPVACGGRDVDKKSARKHPGAGFSRFAYRYFSTGTSNLISSRHTVKPVDDCVLTSSEAFRMSAVSTTLFTSPSARRSTVVHSLHTYSLPSR